MLTQQEFIAKLKDADKNGTVEEWNSIEGKIENIYHEHNTYEEYIKDYEIEEDECINFNNYEIGVIYEAFIEALEIYKKTKEEEIKIPVQMGLSIYSQISLDIYFKFKNNKIEYFKTDAYDDQRETIKYILNIDIIPYTKEKEEKLPLASSKDIKKLIDKYK